jgi:large subunit ribosomal protein L6
MSRIGKKPIAIPEKTTVTFDGRTVTVKGPLGELSRVVPTTVTVEVKDGSAHVSARGVSSSALSGTFASHLKNMIKGVNEVYTKKLIVEGIGFKSDVKGTDLVLSLGFSHQVTVAIPTGLKVTAEKNIITVSGTNKETVGGFTSDIRSLKKPEPYKGKGIRYETEVIRRKQGKKTA